jgi:hypothetical protein
MAKHNTLRQFTRQITLATTVPAATTTYDVPLPAGAYNLAVLVKSSVTGTSTTVTLRPKTGADGDQVNGVDLRMVEPDDSAPVAALTLPAGAAGRYASVVPSASASPVPGPIVVGDSGLQATITKGGAVTDELLEVIIVAQRI